MAVPTEEEIGVVEGQSGVWFGQLGFDEDEEFRSRRERKQKMEVGKGLICGWRS